MLFCMKTLQVRIKDKHARALEAMAREVNFVWNYTNELSFKHTQRTGKFFSAFDMAKYTAGASREGFAIHSQTVQAITEEYVVRRKQFCKAKLHWRVSQGSRKSLGWIPFKVGAVVYKGGQLKYAGQFFSLWDSFGLGNYALRSGSFSQDARGRWYANLIVDVSPLRSPATEEVGIDLGLKDFATLSDGTKVAAQSIYRQAEAYLTTAQRAHKSRQIKTIHAQIKNRRKDFHHKLSTGLVKRYGAIFIGNVNAAGLARTGMAKSVLDAGWSAFRTMLQYKSIAAGVWFEEVDERFTTQICSSCGDKPDSRPKGIADLRIRDWMCSSCGALHDRDVNAANNILRRARTTLAAGIPVV